MLDDSEIIKMEKEISTINLWLKQPDLPADLKKELLYMKDGYGADPEDAEIRNEIHEKFYRDLEFGTGGMRGVLGAGTNRMNLYVVRRITQGVADHINSERRGGTESARPTVAIACDNRHKSSEFALETACVLLANGIGVYIFPHLTPTPALSFAVRRCGCRAGVMITASHNPKEYNGYKLYGADGCQSLPEEADAVADRIGRLDMFRDVLTMAGELGGGGFDEKLRSAESWRGQDGPARLRVISRQLEEAYLEKVMQTSVKKQNFSNFSIVYTPLYGTGNVPVREAFKQAGIERVSVVSEQESPSGSFETCPYPNPEKREALERGLALCEALGAQGDPPDLLLATDPDCDRAGVAVRRGNDYEQLSGNEIGVLLLDFICASKIKAGKMPERPIAFKSLVSSPLASVVAAGYGVEMVNVLPGFKFIGEQITNLENKGEEDRYIFGFEESCGYLSGTHVRDKDGVNAGLLICEMAAAYKDEGLTLLDALEAVYRRCGFHLNSLVEFSLRGEAGLKKIGRVMKTLREKFQDGLFSRKVAEFTDYLAPGRGAQSPGTNRGAENRAKVAGTRKSDILEYAFEGGGGFIARPSGTEPKLKIYLSESGETRGEAEERISRLKKEIETLVNGVE
ncbi:MAG: phospho-sugar mutase [Clostridiales Family XIII bacterium]|jgi:phosphoglucomutase|nr:phospho-sugar mutase [Clostridiales Family XIII bacterium]